MRVIALVGRERRESISNENGVVIFHNVAVGTYYLQIGDGYFQVTSVREGRTPSELSIPHEVFKERREATGRTEETPEIGTPTSQTHETMESEHDEGESAREVRLRPRSRGLVTAFQRPLSVWWKKPGVRDSVRRVRSSRSAPTEQFTTTLKPLEDASAPGKANTNLCVELEKSKSGSEIPLHTEPPNTATCYLQVWEIDFFDRKTRYESDSDEAQLKQRENRLLAAIPGFVLRDGQNDTFHVLGEPHLHYSNIEGPSLELDLSGMNTRLRVPVGENEGVAEFAATLALSADDDSMRTRTGPTRIVHFVHSELEHQISTYGGISVAFVADYGFETASNNDKEFEYQAHAMIKMRAVFALREERVSFDIHVIKSYAEIGPALNSLTAAVMSELGLGGPPKVSTLMLYAHGMPAKMQIGANYGAPGSLSTARVQKFVDGVKEYLTDNCVVTLFACSTGRLKGRGKVTARQKYGCAQPGDPLGSDSLAWTLARALEEVGLAHATVWAHTTPAHVTRNSDLRVFSPYGDADFVSFLGGARRVSEKYKKRYKRMFSGNPFDKDADNNTPYFEQLERQNVLRAAHLQSARYLPWARVGCPAVDWDHAYDRTAGHNECAAILEYYRGFIGEDAGGGATGFELDQHGTSIVGPTDAGGLRTSEHFEYSEFLHVGAGLPLPLSLLQGLELLRLRWGKPIIVVSSEHGGESGTSGFLVRPSSGSAADVLTHAERIASYGRFFLHAHMAVNGKEVWVSMVQEDA